MKKKKRNLASNVCQTGTADCSYGQTTALDSPTLNGSSIGEEVLEYLYNGSPRQKVVEGESDVIERLNGALGGQEQEQADGDGNGNGGGINDACVEEKKNSPFCRRGIETEGSLQSCTTPEDSPPLTFPSSSSRYFSPEGPQRSGPEADILSLSNTSGSETPVLFPPSPDTARLSPPAYTSISLIPPNVYKVRSSSAWGEKDAKDAVDVRRESGHGDNDSNFSYHEDHHCSNAGSSNKDNSNNDVSTNSRFSATKSAKKFTSKFAFSQFENSQLNESSSAARSTHINVASSSQSVRQGTAGNHPSLHGPHSNSFKSASKQSSPKARSVSSRSSPSSKIHLNQNGTSAKRAREKDKEKEVSVKTNVLVVDEAFTRSFSECFVVRLFPRELAIILDSLGFPLNAETVKICDRNSTSSGAGKSRFIELSLFNENLFASTLCDAVRENSFIDKAAAQPGEAFSISKKKTLIAMNQIKSLLVGEWIAVRELVLKITRMSMSASEDNDNRDSHSCYESKNDGGEKTDSSTDSVVDCRPSLWPEKQIDEFLRLCRFPNINGSTFNIGTGKDFLDAKLESVSSSFNMTQSLLRERFIIFQRFLRILDAWWGRGLRPSDPYSATFKMLADTLTVDTDESYLCEGRSMEKEREEKEEEEGEDGVPSDRTVPYTGGLVDENLVGPSRSYRTNDNTTNNSNSNNNNDSNSSSSCSSITRQDLLDTKHTTRDEIVRLSLTSALLLSWSPLNRAYGWNVPLSVLTSLSKRIGGMRTYHLRFLFITF